MLTKRDMEIMNFVNEFGFCEMPHIEKRFDLKKPRSYQVMSRLIEAELVKHQRVFHGRHGIFYLTKKGADCTDLPPLRGLPKDNYIHQLKIIDVYLQLRTRFLNFHWIGERRIRHDEFMDGIGKRNNHLPDGLFIDRDYRQTAIEVELTMKSKKRLEDILWSYMLHKDIKEVWYFCAPEIVGKVAKIADKMKGIRIIPLE